MNLISCEHCGVVLDKDKLGFPDPWTEEGEIDTRLAAWEGDYYVVMTECPVCKGEIKGDRI